MKIALVTGEYPPMQGGVGDFTREIARALLELGCHVRVVTDWSHLDSARNHHARDYDIWPVISPRWGWRDLWRIKNATADVDLVNVQYQAAAYGDMRIPIHLVPRVITSPSVVTFHDLRVPYLFPKAGSLRWGAIMEMASRADGIIVTNSDDYQTLSNTAKICHIAEIPIGSNIQCSPPPGFDPESWRSSHGVGKDEFLLGYFGFLNSSKGGESLIRSLALLLEDAVPVRLALIGGQQCTSDPTNEEYDEWVETLQEEMGISGRIIRTGFLSPTDVSAALLSCHAMVMPYRDGASLRRGTLMACLNHGCPTITTEPTTSIPQLQHGENIYLVPVDSPQALVAAVNLLRNDFDRRIMLGNGAKVLSKMFTWDKIALQTIDYFERVVQTR